MLVVLLKCKTVTITAPKWWLSFKTVIKYCPQFKDKSNIEEILQIFGDGRHGLENLASLCGPKNFCFHANEKWLWPDVSNMKIQNVAADVSDQILKNLWRQSVGTVAILTKTRFDAGQAVCCSVAPCFYLVDAMKNFSCLKALAQIHRTYNKFHCKEKNLQLAKPHVLKPTRCPDKSHGTCFSYLKEKVSTLSKFRGFAHRDTPSQKNFSDSALYHHILSVRHAGSEETFTGKLLICFGM